MDRLTSILRRLAYTGSHRSAGTVWETHDTPYAVRMSHMPRHGA